MVNLEAYAEDRKLKIRCSKFNSQGNESYQIVIDKSGWLMSLWQAKYALQLSQQEKTITKDA